MGAGDLETFVLGYMEQVGSIIEPPAHGVRQVLLPEAVAERWQTPAFQSIAFADTDQTEVTRLGYNHPLVEQMVQDASAQVASTRAFITDIRLQKNDLEELAAKNWVLLNGRVEAQPQASVSRCRSTYLLFNFKAAILSDEKQEQLVSVLMDAHSGHPAADARMIEIQATTPAPDDVLKTLTDAPIRWRPAGSGPLETPLDRRTLDALLERSQRSVLHDLSDQLGALEKRVKRFRELDHARLTEYYDGLERDLCNRLNRVSPDRQAGLADKLEAVRAERELKLTDLDERFHVRLDLTLLNLMVIQQPKLVLPVTIKNRNTRISVHAVWDPLLHLLEPLICDVCGLPIQRAYLCHNGHLAHKSCLAPGCIDCNRIFCQQCADEVGTCDVCNQPLCRHSRIICDTCGRGTCREHVNLCHANDGKPVDLEKESTPTPPESEDTPSLPPLFEPPQPKSIRSSKQPSPRKTKRLPSRNYTGTPKPQRIEVVVYVDVVEAFVLASRERQIARRTWNLIPLEGGIVRTCECEKGDECKANNIVIRPAEWMSIDDQIQQEIQKLRQEYGLPSRKVNYNLTSMLDDQFVPMLQFKLFGLWRDKNALDKARAAFDRLPKSRLC